jgi:2-methylaconitate cis-trans-isomerase PrpF
MDLAESLEQATKSRPATPKLAFVAPVRDYISSAGKQVHADDIDLTVRILSMGALHHALTGTGAIALAVAAALPGTLVQKAIGSSKNDAVAFNTERIRLGHPSGVLSVGAITGSRDGQWEVAKALVSRSARRLMDGQVFLPSRDHAHE